eukprot:PLAT3336.2.p1 GENE.PLAT3336.2~~PLAT3336.2.p1  ORF type:complete len:276 (-),score=105.04 PLAT3336.2:66-812(-)
MAHAFEPLRDGFTRSSRNIHSPLVPCLVAEALGSFGLTVVSRMAGTATAVSAAYAALLFALGHVSGGHFNPAVTLGVVLRGRAAKRAAAGYVVAQLVGAFAGAFLGAFLAPAGVGDIGPLALPQPHKLYGPLRAFMGEAVMSLLLVLVFLSVAAAESTEGNSFFGLAAATVVYASGSSIGAISGSSLNPAAATALQLSAVALRHGNAASLWLYWLAPLAGAAAAALLFRIMNADELATLTARSDSKPW